MWSSPISTAKWRQATAKAAGNLSIGSPATSPTRCRCAPRSTTAVGDLWRRRHRRLQCRRCLRRARIGELDDALLRKSFELNFFAHQSIAQNAVRIFAAQGTGGVLLFNTSKQAVNPGANFGAYGLPKAATLFLSRQYALEYGAIGVRSNAVNADRIRSGILTDEMIASRAKARGVSEKDYMSGNLLGLEVTAEHVAAGLPGRGAGRAHHRRRDDGRRRQHRGGAELGRDPEKRAPVFGQDHARARTKPREQGDEGRRKALPLDLAERGRPLGRPDRPAPAAARVPRRDGRHRRRHRHRHPRHVGARRAADRGDGRLRHRARDARRPLRRGLDAAWDELHATRPTAINLRWALDDLRTLLAPLPEPSAPPPPGAAPARSPTRMSS